MEKSGEHFESRPRFEDVIVGISQDRLLGSLVAMRAQIVVDGHVLHGSGRRVVECKVVPFFPRGLRPALPLSIGYAPGMVPLSLFWLHSSQRERIVAVFAVVNIAKIDFVFTSKKELMRWRETGQRSGAGIEDEQPVAGAYVHRSVVRCAPKADFLRLASRVAPDYLGVISQGKALHASLVNVGHVIFVSFRNRLLPKQVRALVGGKLQRAGELS